MGIAFCADSVNSATSFQQPIWWRHWLQTGRAVRVFEFDGVMVEDFAVVRAFAGFGAVAAGADRVTAFEPVDDVEIVDVLFDDVVAADPDEVIPVAHLVFHFGQLASCLLFQFSAGVAPGCVAVPIRTHRNDVADCAVLEFFDGVDVAGLVMALEADTDLQIFRFRFCCCCEDFADAGERQRPPVFP